jgi:hypothetical protein
MSWYRRIRQLLFSRPRWVGIGVAVAAPALSVAALAGPAAATAGPTPPDGSANYSFRTLDNHNDPTFNQLLGINNAGVIAGYFGSGMAGHPNKGYELFPNYGQGNYRNENFPGSAQTQVTGLNNQGITVGFWVDSAGNNSGFYAIHRHHFHKVNFPTSDNAKPRVDQLLGVNDSGIAVGFYTDSHAVNHGFSYNIARHRFHSIHVSGDSNVTAATVNDLGDIAGFATSSSGVTEAYLLRSDGHLRKLNFPGASSTQAFGVNDGDAVVGTYTVGSGSTATMHGFVWSPGFGFQTVNDPNGLNSTVVNGVNDRGDLVGFYTDSAGNTDGMLATP